VPGWAEGWVGRLPCNVGLSSEVSRLFAWTYQPAYQPESTVFFSHNKTASASLSAGFNTSQTGQVSLTYHFLMGFLQRNLTALLSKTIGACKLMIDQLVRLRVVEPAHPGKSSTWHGCSYFFGFIPWFNGAMLLVVGDVPIDSEAPVMISWISRSAGAVLRMCS